VLGGSANSSAPGLSNSTKKLDRHETQKNPKKIKTKKRHKTKRKKQKAAEAPLSDHLPGHGGSGFLGSSTTPTRKLTPLDTGKIEVVLDS
jgi:hypothetical protein